MQDDISCNNLNANFINGMRGGRTGATGAKKS
jgi:hypothetical protein